MYPTLEIGDYVIARQTKYYEPRRKDIIVFNRKLGEKNYVKRVIGLPGETVCIIDGSVFINGEILEEDYVANTDDISGEYEVPEGKLFVLGDNRKYSKDSRYVDFGFANIEDVIGVYNWMIPIGG